MKDILIGFALMFTVYSCVQFWFWFIDLEKGKQVKLKDYIFGGKKWIRFMFLICQFMLVM